MKRLPVLALALALLACNGSPTEPENRTLQGTYEGEVRAFPSGEDWTNVRLTVATTGDTVTGTLLPKSGPSHPVTGQRVSGVYSLEVKELPQSTPCFVTLTVNQIGAASIRGDLGGRCPSTLMTTFRLNRR